MRRTDGGDEPEIEGGMSMEDMVKSINKSMETIRDHDISVKPGDLPSDISILLSGVSGNSGMSFLFSPKVDQMIDSLMNIVISGNWDQYLNNEDSMKSLLSSMGFGKGAFEGKVSRTVIGAIQQSTNSAKYMKAKSKLHRILIIIRNLKSHKKDFATKEEKKQYNDAIYAIKHILWIIYKIYKNRRLINDKVWAGTRNIVYESAFVGPEESIEPIIGEDW
jgi:hypothetical protein